MKFKYILVLLYFNVCLNCANATSKSIPTLENLVHQSDNVIVAKILDGELILNSDVEQCVFLHFDIMLNTRSSNGGIYVQGVEGPVITSIDDYIDWFYSQPEENRHPTYGDKCATLYTISVEEIVKGKVLDSKLYLYSLNDFEVGRELVLFIDKVMLTTHNVKNKPSNFVSVTDNGSYLSFKGSTRDNVKNDNNIWIPELNSEVSNTVKHYRWKDIKKIIKKYNRK